MLSVALGTPLAVLLIASVITFFLNIRFNEDEEEKYRLYINVHNPNFNDWYCSHAISRNTNDSGFDLKHVDKNFIMYPNTTELLDSGIRAVMTFGTEKKNFPVPFDIRARSSISKTPLILHNGIGTIDSEYRGPLKVALRNLSNDGYEIGFVTSLAQICLPTLDPFEVNFVENPEDLPFFKTKRGEGGFGSTNSKTSTDNQKINPEVELNNGIKETIEYQKISESVKKTD